MTDCIRVAKFKAEEAPGRDCPMCAAGWQGWPARRVNSAVRGRGGAEKWPTFSEPHCLLHKRRAEVTLFQGWWEGSLTRFMESSAPSTSEGHQFWVQSWLAGTEPQT